MMSDATTSTHTWVAIGPAGTVGWITSDGSGYSISLVGETEKRGSYPSLDVAKSALHASLVPGSDWPEFSEH
jgi:hypothetical protein